MKVSVIVPAFNEEKLIGETLRHIGAAAGEFAARGLDSEAIVCDNNSTDRTGELARAAGARVVFEPVNQIARARNRGAQAASGDWLMFIDADSFPSPELFADVAEEIQRGRCLAGGCTMKLDGHYPLASLLTGCWNWISRTQKLLAGSCIFCAADAFQTVGGFNNKLFAGEELDLSKRLKQLARETGREIVVLHRHPLTTSPRKLHLYSRAEQLRFVLRALLNRERTLTDRRACYQWYDGRR